MSKLKEQFTLNETKSEPYWKLDIEGDWNDADYVNGGTEFSDKKWDNLPDLVLYAISFLDSYGSHYEDNEIWNEFFREADLDYELGIPYGYEQACHSFELSMKRFDGTREFDVEIPYWNSLFKDEADMRKKLTKANEDWDKRNRGSSFQTESNWEAKEADAEWMCNGCSCCHDDGCW